MNQDESSVDKVFNEKVLSELAANPQTTENHSPSAITMFSINTQVIIQNRVLSLARYLGLSADNHLHRQNGCQ